MRLNFSGSDEDEIREGVRRIGAVVGEQVELFRTITGEHTPTPGSSASEPGGRTVIPAEGRDAGPGGSEQDEESADVLPLRRREGR
jgi:2-aminoadipate transaminase